MYASLIEYVLTSPKDVFRFLLFAGSCDMVDGAIRPGARTVTSLDTSGVLTYKMKDTYESLY